MAFVSEFITVKGSGHDVNEDCSLCRDGLVVVADGMGGESDGDTASRITIDTVAAMLADVDFDTKSDDECREAMFAAIARADQAISSYVDQRPESFGMGSTVVVTVMSRGRLLVAWVGDSRCYVYSKSGGLRRVTTDHSYVQELIDEGKLTDEGALVHPQNNLITRFVGGAESCVPEFIATEYGDDDIVITCSDGLCGYCLDKEIRSAVGKCKSAGEITRNLSDLALKRGCDDDITVVVTLDPDRFPHKKGFPLFGLFGRG